MSDTQQVLFENPPDWRDKWTGMPQFEREDQTPWQSITIHLRSREDRNQLAELIGSNLSDKTPSVWFPPAEIARFRHLAYDSRNYVPTRYPIYVISKGRWESRLTIKSLEAINLPYRVVVEPQEVEQYTAVIPRENILTLPFSNLGQGSIPARNWVWEHSVKAGHKRHWILDDNIEGFYRYNHNMKMPVGCGAIFRAAEDFVDRYQNVAISGFNYFMFVDRKTTPPAYVTNTRVYSCILIQNNIPYRWRGRYNEDTDLSLRALKDGWCTILFNAFLAWKMNTMTMKGGNTEDLYEIDDGRLKMAQSLVDQHPDVARVSWKWGRHQHHVDYSGFKNNKLVQVPSDATPEGEDNYGMELMTVDIPVKYRNEP